MTETSDGDRQVATTGRFLGPSGAARSTFEQTRLVGFSGPRL